MTVLKDKYIYEIDKIYKYLLGITRYLPISKNVSPKLFLKMYNESLASSEAMEAVAMLKILVWDAVGCNFKSNPGVREVDGEVKLCRSRFSLNSTAPQQKHVNDMR